MERNSIIGEIFVFMREIIELRKKGLKEKM